MDEADIDTIQAKWEAINTADLLQGDNSYEFLAFGLTGDVFPENVIKVWADAHNVTSKGTLAFRTSAIAINGSATTAFAYLVFKDGISYWPSLGLHLVRSEEGWDVVETIYGAEQ